MKVEEDITRLIGNTPVVKLVRVVDRHCAELYLKLEWHNPGGSVKDRPALAMIEGAERAGRLRPGDTIIEPTSGNMGMGLAMVAASKGYGVLLVMPDTLSKERRSLLHAYGADLVLTPGHEGMRGAIAKAESIAEENPNKYFMPCQFDNPDNVKAHREFTGPEIVHQMKGQLDAFVAGVGTGGTISGVGEVLRQDIPDCRIVAVEPQDSPVLSGGSPGPHQIQGLGAGFIPGILNRRLLDRVVTVSNEDANEMARRLAEEESLFVGISTGAAVHAAIKIAKELGPKQKVLTISPSGGERYLSTSLYHVE